MIICFFQKQEHFSVIPNLCIVGYYFEILHLTYRDTYRENNRKLAFAYDVKDKELFCTR